MSTNNPIAFHTTLEAFLSSDEFPSSILKATHQAWQGGTYRVELFPDGHYRCLWSQEIGNKYDTPGIMLKVPSLDDEDYQDLLEIAQSLTNTATESEVELINQIGYSDQLEETKEEMREALRETLIPLAD